MSRNIIVPAAFVPRQQQELVGFDLRRHHMRNYGRPGFGKGAGSVGDEHWDSVVLLSHLDAQPAVDLSTTPHTLTTNGGSIQSTTVKWGDAAYDAEKATLGSISAADHADWLFGASQQFTAECWANFTSFNTVNSILGQWKTGGNQRSWFLYYHTGNGFLYFLYSPNGVAQTLLATDAWTPTFGQWYHIAVDRDASDDIRVYIDGNVRHGPTTVSTAFKDSTAALTIGNSDDNLASWAPDAIIDEVRITKGVGRYGGAFAIPSGPFPSVGL